MNSDESRFRDLVNEPPFDGSYRKEHHQQLRQKVVESFDAAQAVRSRRSFPNSFLNWRQIMGRPAPRFAAAALVLAAVCTGFVVLLQSNPTVAFASIIEPILKAKTARFNVVIEGENLPKQTVRTLFLEPNRFRQEMPDGPIQIIDAKAGKMLILTPAQKSATLFNSTDMATQQNSPNFFDQLRTSLRAADKEASSKREALERKLITGREALGFRLKQPHADMTIWGDPKTGLPILVEMTIAMLPGTKVTMTDFEFDVELDEALFKLEAPNGYSFHELKVTTPAEKDLIAALKLLSDHNEGLFPDTCDRKAMVAFVTSWVQKNPGEPNAAWTKKVTDLSLSLSQGLTFAATLPAESNARYAGKGIKYNDATTPVFWYKPAGSSSYRVIHGDLSVKEQKTAPSSPNGVPINAGNPVADWSREIMDRQQPKLAPPMEALPVVPAPPPVAVPKN
jgi:outer membrane lipoprotein-sorting protein